MKKAYNRLLTQHAVLNGTHGLAGDSGKRCSAHARHGGRCRMAFEIEKGGSLLINESLKRESRTQVETGSMLNGEQV